MELYLSIQRHYSEFSDDEWHKSDVFDREIPLFKEFPEFALAKSFIKHLSIQKAGNLIFISKRHRPKKRNHVEYIYYFNHSNPFKLKVYFKDYDIYTEDLIIERGDYFGKILKYEISEDDYEQDGDTDQ